MNDDEFMAEVRQVFNEESSELLEDFEAVLLKLEDDPGSEDLINELFRTVHTIKGSAGILGYDDVVAFTHIAESVMGRLRDKELALDETLLSLLLDSCDQTRDLIRQALEAPGEPLTQGMAQKGDGLIGRLKQYLDDDTPAGVNQAAASPGYPATHDGDPGALVANDFWHISLRMQPDALQHGLDPIYFFNYLANVGKIVNLSLLPEELPSFIEMQPEKLYPGFEIDIDSSADKDAIASVFDFMRGECVLHILPPRSKIAEYMLMINALPEENMAIGEILVASGALTEDELAEALAFQQDQTVGDTLSDGDSDPLAAEARPQIGEVLIDNGVADSSVIEAAARKQQRVREAKQAELQSVRVNADKLGDLINLVGELVISSANTELRARQTGQKALIESTQHLIRLVEEIRDASLTLRMMQIGDTFNRYKRVVRDTSKELGKKIDLRISGGDTELDKTVIERISDPLMHLIRNALDHGVETPEQRVAQGKPETATVSLEAYHDSGSIVIELADDGRGLDPEVLIAKAIENGVITANKKLSLGEIHRLIFAPGFSTASEVTSISGRGVGMDVVNRNIDALRGRISVESELGIGTRFIIRLPLTLAIIDGFQVQVGESSYVIPLDLVDECIELETIQSATQSGEYIDLRGEVMPYLHLADVFSGVARGAQSQVRNNIVVVHYAGQRTGLVVDELLGEQQTVIKPLGPVFKNLKGISGATILGGGEVAMIIDVPALVTQYTAANPNCRNPRPLN
jgi:two-component system chemotaxis sensor kinase CheA